VRIKALPLSQSKQEKRTEGVITIQRGKYSWNERPQTSGSLTPPLTRAPRTRARLHAHYRHPRPLCSALPPPTPPFAAHPPPSSPATGPPLPMSRLLPRVTCSITTTPHLEQHLACQSPINPPPAPSVPIPSKTLQIKPPLPNRKQLHFPLPRP
jgi:hypothetical protein